VRVVPPIAAVACTVYVPAGVPLGRGAVLPPPPQDDSSRRLSAKSGRAKRDFLSRVPARNRMASASSEAIVIGNAGNLRSDPGRATGVTKLRAIVVTFTLKETGPVPEICTLPGDALQPPAGGAFVHPNVTVPVNPFTALNCSGIAAVCPAATVAEVVPPVGGPI